MDSTVPGLAPSEVEGSRFTNHGSGAALAAPMHPGRDLAALEQFAYELLCDASPAFGGASRPSSSTPRLRAAALNPTRLERAADSPTRRARIPLAYEIWLDYLFELDTLLHYVRLSPRALTGLELQGLQALARARARFLRSHSFCPHCNVVNPRSAQRCTQCHKEL